MENGVKGILDEADDRWHTKRKLPSLMNKSVFLFAVGSAFVLGLPLAASAYDDDPGYGAYRPWYGGEDRTYRRGEYGGDRDRLREPLYYRPTQRYYAKGYTVSYRYMPVYWYDLNHSQQAVTSNFRTEGFRIATEDIPAWGAKPPRLVVANKKTPSQGAVTSIIRTKQPTGYAAPSYSAPTELPVPSVPLPTPNLDPSPVPEAPKP